MIQTRFSSRLVASAAAGLIVLGAGVSPAAAVQDPGGPVATSTLSWRAAVLERIGTQFVRGDYLTGAGVEAPSYLPEQR